VAVQIQDAYGNPALATRNTVVLLSSLNETVGTVPDSVTISKGRSTVYTTFYSTYMEGSTTIVAFTPGLAPGWAGMTTTTGLTPTKLAVILAPPQLPNDNSGHSYPVKVQLQDANGNPAESDENTYVALTSSNMTVGTVPSSMTIYAGRTYASTSFTTTYTPGWTNIVATAAGYASGSAVMTTIGATASKLAVILGPPQFPNDNSGHSYPVKVQLQDVNGDPAKAPISAIVTLASSNLTVGTVPSSLTISTGKTYASTSFTTTYTPGWTNITATAAGYASGSAVMTTIGVTASKLAVILGPPQFPNDNSGHSYPVKVQLQDEYGNPAKAPISTVVTLTSSNPTVGTVPSSVTISAGRTYVSTSFTTTYKSGSTMINVAAAGYTSGSASMETVGAIPSKLAVILAPPKVPHDNSYHNYAVKVQLQDEYGNPAKAPISTVVTLTSSNPTVGTVPGSITISAGKTYAYTHFKSTYSAGSTTITATAAGYTSDSTVMTTATGLTPSKLAVILGPSKLPNDNSGHSYSVIVQLQDTNGNPAPASATTVVLLTSSNENVGTIPASVTISSGKSTTYTTFTSTYAPGLTTITAFTIGYSPRSSAMTTGWWYLGTSIYTDKYSYTTGETMNVGLDVSNPGPETDINVKVWLELPTGATYTLLNIPSVTLPAGLSYSNPTQWSFMLPSISTGIYVWHAVLADPASGAILSQDTAAWEFT